MTMLDRPELALYQWLSHWLVTFWMTLVSLLVGFFALRAWWQCTVRKENFERLENSLGQNAIERMAAHRAK